MNTAVLLADASRYEDPIVRYQACKAMAKGLANAIYCEEIRLKHARVFCAIIIRSYWQTLAKKHNSSIKIKSSPYLNSEIESDVISVALETGKLISLFPAEDAGFLIGSIYTVMLPNALRSTLGAYYTPPPLVSRLLDNAEKAGINFATDSVIDPACGGGAFLAPIALRMLKKMPVASAEWTLKQISSRLKGIEIDPFAAWMTSVLLEAALMSLCIKSKRRLPNLVLVGDSLEQFKNVGTFNLVIGNPPYGRLKLSNEQRTTFSRSLYGHANLYGLFTDLAIRIAQDNGVIAYLTPTSFLGGRRINSLRRLLLEESTLVSIDFIADRKGVFDDVLQETLLTTYRKEKNKRHASLSLITPQGLDVLQVDTIGKMKIPLSDGGPWVLPRTATDVKLISLYSKMSTRISDLGYTVSTGQLVWNRYKSQLRSMKVKNSLPLIWAESITSNGFSFSAQRKNHVPYITIESNQAHLITKKTCVLLQRTTSKEQKRRLVSTVLPQDFLDSNNGLGVVVENHINIISSTGDKNVESISPCTISILLNSQAVDRAFRAISGSVAVSAYELNALPLPTLAQVITLESLIKKNTTHDIIEEKIASFYGDSA